MNLLMLLLGLATIILAAIAKYYQIQGWQIVLCAENATQCNPSGRELFETPKVCFRGARLAGTIRKPNGGASAVAQGGEPRVLLAGKPAQANTAIRLALEEAPQAAEHVRNGGIRVARSASEPIGGHWTAVREPMVQKNFERDE